MICQMISHLLVIKLSVEELKTLLDDDVVLRKDKL